MRVDVTIDQRITDRLRSLLKDKFPEALQMALINTQSYIDQVCVALDEADYVRARAMAHKIVSSAGTFGMVPVVERARAIEQGEEDRTPQAWLNLWQDLQRHFVQSSDTLHQLYPVGQDVS